VQRSHIDVSTLSGGNARPGAAGDGSWHGRFPAPSSAAVGPWPATAAHRSMPGCNRHATLLPGFIYLKPLLQQSGAALSMSFDLPRQAPQSVVGRQLPFQNLTVDQHRIYAVGQLMPGVGTATTAAVDNLVWQYSSAGLHGSGLSSEVSHCLYSVLRRFAVMQEHDQSQDSAQALVSQGFPTLLLGTSAPSLPFAVPRWNWATCLGRQNAQQINGLAIFRQREWKTEIVLNRAKRARSQPWN